MTTSRLKHRSYKHLLLRAFAVGVLYFAVASITIAATSDGRSHAAIWLADAIVLAALLSFPKRQWGAILLAGLLANHLANDFTRGIDPAHILYGLTNMGQVWIAASIMLHGQARSFLADARGLWRFVAAAGIVAPAIGATFGSAVTAFVYEQPYVTSYVRWFASNALGLFVATPFLKDLFEGSLTAAAKQQTPAQRRNMGAALLLFTLVVYVTFSKQDLPLLFLPVCALVMIAIWLGRIGVKIAVLILAIVATGTTLEGYGPLNQFGFDEFRMATFFQVYLAVLLLTGTVVVTIVTARSDAMARLADREQMLRQILAHGQDVLLSFNSRGVCAFCAGPAQSLLGREASEIVGRDIGEIAMDTAPSLAVLVAQQYALAPRPFSIEFQLTHGERKWVEASMAPIVIEECLTSFVISLRDITSQRQKTNELQRRAMTDELTQTLNRAGFDMQVKEATDGSGPVALALVDVDNFKTVNDTYGHASGDEVLVIIAEIIAAHVREGDAVARIGGDEFAILFRSGPEAAEAACERICAAINDMRIFATDRRLINVTVSCGVAGLRAGCDARAMFEAADRALYQVKENGRNGARLVA